MLFHFRRLKSATTLVAGRVWLGTSLLAHLQQVRINPTWLSLKPHFLSRFRVLRSQCQRQHQREADLRATGWHHLWKDVWEPGRRRPCRHRGQAGAPADRAARPSSPGLCMLRLRLPPQTLCPPCSSSSPLSWTPGPRVNTSSPFSLPVLLLSVTCKDHRLGGSRTRSKGIWIAVRCLHNGLCLFMVLPHERAKSCCFFKSVWVLVWYHSECNQTGAFQTLCSPGSWMFPPSLSSVVSLYISMVLQEGFNGMRPQSAVQILPKFTVLCFMSVKNLGKMLASDAVTEQAAVELLKSGAEICSILMCYISHVVLDAQTQTVYLNIENVTIRFFIIHPCIFIWSFYMFLHFFILAPILLFSYIKHSVGTIWSR